MASNQTECSMLVQMSVTKFLWLGSANFMKFIEECVIFRENQILEREMFTNRLNMGLLQ